MTSLLAPGERWLSSHQPTINQWSLTTHCIAFQRSLTVQLRAKTCVLSSIIMNYNAAIVILRLLIVRAAWWISSQILPTELKHYIGTFCIPSSLASLAQVHTTYRQEAERVLYKKIYLYIWNSEAKRCLDTLSSNREKASFVDSLTVEFPSNWNKHRDESLRAVVALSTTLCHTPALSDLRIRLPNSKPDDLLPERITDSLRSVR